MKKIAVITSTRAEFGLLCPLIKALRGYEDEEFRTELVVTGTHLSEAYGHTIDEIEESGLRIDVQIGIPVNSADALAISANQAAALEKFTALFESETYSGIVLLGDRYEMLAIAIAAGNTHTPVFHLCGGDTTEGAMDEWIRHSITKISTLHFPTNEQSYRRILQLGEEPERVFCYGSTSMDNVLSLAGLTEREALRSIGLKECSYALGTYHPVTLEEEGPGPQMKEFLSAIEGAAEAFPELEFIVTKSNADQGGGEINGMLEEAAGRMEHLHVYASLGAARYLSLMKHAQFVLGNSSSGIIETPAFGIPTVNIGDRQRGRLQSESTINCAPDRESILAAMKKAMQPAYREQCRAVASPYGDGHAAEKIAKKIFDAVMEGKIDLKKKFYDYGHGFVNAGAGGTQQGISS